MTRAQKIIIGVMVCLVIAVLIAVMLAFFGLVRQNRTAQVKELPPPTTFPTVVYPATYTPTPPSGAATPVLENGPDAVATTPQPRATIDPNNPVAVALDAAMKKAQTAKQGRFNMNFSMEGDFGSDIPPGWAQDGKLTLIAVNGATKGADSQLAIQGMLASMLGADPNKGIEFMTVDGKTYLRGPMTFLGITDDKWYVATGASQLPTNNASPEQLLTGLDRNLNWAGIRAAGVETLDGMNCQTYIADKAATLDGMKAFDDATKQLPSDFNVDAVEFAETKFWICDDGYFHQMTLNLRAKNKSKPSEMIGMAIAIHLYDYDGNFKITPPENATPLDLSKFNGKLPALAPQ